MYHYNDVIMNTVTSQITGLTIVYSTVYSGADQGKHQSSASLAFVWGIHRGAVNSPHKGPVTRNIFPFHDVIMTVSHTLLVRFSYITSPILCIASTIFPKWFLDTWLKFHFALILIVIIKTAQILHILKLYCRGMCRTVVLADIFVHIKQHAS